jgi:predicted Zn-dependent protease with MMP-like domain
MLPQASMTRKAPQRESGAYELLDAIDAHLDDEDYEQARATLARAIELTGADDPEVLYSEACIVSQQHGVEAAAELLQRVIELDPRHADAHYALARLAEERGMPQHALEHDLHVLRLDARDLREARAQGELRKDAVDRIERIAYEVLHDLPAPFAERLAHVPVILQARPTPSLVKDGIDPRALGLFEGPTDGDTGTAAPSRIVLFTHNLLADFPDEEELGEQIEITLLHEIGHFFGLDEDDMERLGLD